MNGGPINIDNVLPTKKEAKAETELKVKEEKDSAVTAESNRTLLSWSGESFDYAEKGIIWYSAAVFILLAIIGYFVWQKDWFSIGITVVVSGILFWYTATARPKTIEYSLTTFGVQAGERFYPFAEIHSYWMIYTPKVKKVNFELAKKYLPTLVVDISSAEAEKVRIILSRKLPEQEGRGENIIDRVLRVIKL